MVGGSVVPLSYNSGHEPYGWSATMTSSHVVLVTPASAGAVARRSPGLAMAGSMTHLCEVAVPVTRPRRRLGYCWHSRQGDRWRDQTTDHLPELLSGIRWQATSPTSGCASITGRGRVGVSLSLVPVHHPWPWDEGRVPLPCDPTPDRPARQQGR